LSFRVPFLPILAVCAALVLTSCGGGGGKPRPDLVFVSTRNGDYAVFAMNADGSRQTRLTKGSGGQVTSPQQLFFQIDPAWSPDGRRIAFASKRAGSIHIYVMDADGKNTTQLTHTSVDDNHPSWSPDGKLIVFSHGSAGRLEVMSPSGQNVHRVTEAKANETDPSWSPDGRWIAYVHSETGLPDRELWLVHPDGSANHELTKLQASVGPPSWSPDSKRVLFASNARGGHFAIYTIGVSGLGLRLVVASPTDEIDPAWSPDGKTIAFSQDGAIVTISPSGGNEQTITDAKNNDSSPAWNPVQAVKAKGY
jgi:Tol biopolymer transport system component